MCNLVKGVEFLCHNMGIHGSLRHLYLLRGGGGRVRERVRSFCCCDRYGFEFRLSRLSDLGR
jgi:hypothetical protein